MHSLGDGKPCNNKKIHTRCREQGIGFEPIGFDHTGNMNENGKKIRCIRWLMARMEIQPDAREARYRHESPLPSSAVSVIASDINERVLKEISISLPLGFSFD